MIFPCSVTADHAKESVQVFLIASFRCWHAPLSSPKSLLFSRLQSSSSVCPCREVFNVPAVQINCLSTLLKFYQLPTSNTVKILWSIHGWIIWFPLDLHLLEAVDSAVKVAKLQGRPRTPCYVILQFAYWYFWAILPRDTLVSVYCLFQNMNNWSWC